MSGPDTSSEGRPLQSRAARGRKGAYVQQSRHDMRKMTQAGRESFLSRFEQQVDPEGTLDPRERQRRARAARKAYFTDLGLRGAEARRQKRMNGMNGSGGPTTPPG